MRRLLSLFVLIAGILALSGVSQTAAAQSAEAPYDACWGQATAVFALTGDMGEHASEQLNPRLGLANLARQLYGLGVIPEPTLAALGAWVAGELGLSIEACDT